MESPIKLNVTFNNDKTIAYIDGIFAEFDVSRNLVLSVKEYKALSSIVPVNVVLTHFVQEIIKGIDDQTAAKLIIHKNINELNTEVKNAVEILKEFENNA